MGRALLMGFMICLLSLEFAMHDRSMPFKITTYPAGTAKRVINPSAAATRAIPIL